MMKLWCIMKRNRFSLMRAFLTLVFVGFLLRLINYFRIADPIDSESFENGNAINYYPTIAINKQLEESQKQHNVEPLKDPINTVSSPRKTIENIKEDAVNDPQIDKLEVDRNIGGTNGDNAETGFDNEKTGPDAATGFEDAGTGFEDDQKLGHHNSRNLLRVDTTKLLVYGYMRGGTTLLGDIFKTDPGAMYWFEPLTGFYDNLYGLHYYLNPWGITHYPNGSLRNIPAYEEKFVAEKLDNLYRCKLDETPQEVFYRVEDLPGGALEKLHKCIQIHNGGPFAQMFFNCKKHLSETCSHTFQFVSKFEQKCLNPYLNIGNPGTTAYLSDQYEQHESCMNNLKPYLQRCMHLVQAPCNKSSLRVVKALRMTLKGIKGLMQRDSDIKMVHYFRDPRAILASRNSLGGLQMDKNLTFAAKALCDKMEMDYISYNSLTSEEQKRTLQLKYEDLILEPTDTLHKLYDFIERDLPDETLTWLKERMNCKGHENAYSTCRSNARMTAFAWRTKLGNNVIKEINDVCGSLLTLLNYPITF
ncbi:unnamed protein product [Owenia fusiformis]|uniref:Sulfotransferase n=1 Tax=Owenia fusiformis TaxID=6347 RepID=A0A8S4MX87_OWEFU|nr:unnamed protein product [Owenia fusiformis]